MKTTKVKEVEVKESKKELKDAFVLWRQDSEKGGHYLKGHVSEDGTKLIGFFNTNKNNPKEPDVRVYTIGEDGKRDQEVASLWENVAKNESHYLTGKTNESEKLVAWYGDIESFPTRPYIKAYYQEQE